MSRAEQMQYVEAYLRPYADRINNFGDLYMAIHWPAGVGQSDDFVMYREGSDAYTANRGLDSNGDGTVTRGETLAVIERNAPSGGGAIRAETLPPMGQTTEQPTQGGGGSTPVSVPDVAPMDMPVGSETPAQPAPEQPAEAAPAETTPRPAQPTQTQNTEIARSLREVAQGVEGSSVAERATDIATRIEGGEDVSTEELNTLISEALQLPPSETKDAIVNMLYRTALQMRGQ
jgi:hypothetical protein